MILGASRGTSIAGGPWPDKVFYISISVPATHPFLEAPHHVYVSIGGERSQKAPTRDGYSCSEVKPTESSYYERITMWVTARPESYFVIITEHKFGLQKLMYCWIHLCSYSHIICSINNLLKN